MDTRQQQTELTSKDQTQVLDDIGRESIKARVKQLRDEVMVFEENIEKLERDAVENKENFELYKKIKDVMLRDYNFQPLNPTFKYETLVEYKELRKQEIENQIKKDVEKFDHNVKAIAQQKQALINQLESVNKQLKEDLILLGE